jgi:drug/metabolite transporter (DMT)-like permease
LDDYRKPRWWKRSVRSYWLLLVILPFVLILVVLGVLFLQGVTTLTELLTYAFVTIVAIATSYYIREKASLKLQRIMFVGGVGCGIATVILGVLFGLFGKTLVLLLGPWPSFLLSFGFALVSGVLLADYIGKRRNYRPWG